MHAPDWDAKKSTLLRRSVVQIGGHGDPGVPDAEGPRSAEGLRRELELATTRTGASAVSAASAAKHAASAGTAADRAAGAVVDDTPSVRDAVSHVVASTRAAAEAADAAFSAAELARSAAAIRARQAADIASRARINLGDPCTQREAQRVADTAVLAASAAADAASEALTAVATAAAQVIAVSEGRGRLVPRLGSEQARELLAEARARADGWRNGVAATLALVFATLALTKAGEGISAYGDGPKLAITLLLSTSIILGLVSLYKMLRAANGPSWLDTRLQDKARPYDAGRYLGRAEGVREDLFWGQRFWLLSVMLLLSAVIVSWWA